MGLHRRYRRDTNQQQRGFDTQCIIVLVVVVVDVVVLVEVEVEDEPMSVVDVVVDDVVEVVVVEVVGGTCTGRRDSG